MAISWRLQTALPNLPARSITVLDDETRFVVVHQDQVTICDATRGVSVTSTRSESGTNCAVTGDGRWLMSNAVSPAGTALLIDELAGGPPLQLEGTYNDFAYQVLAIPTTSTFVVVQSDGSNNGNYNWLDLIEPSVALECISEGEGDDGERIVDDSAIGLIASFDNHGAAWLADPTGRRLFGLFEHGVAMVGLGDPEDVTVVVGTLDDDQYDEEDDDDDDDDEEDDDDDDDDDDDEDDDEGDSGRPVALDGPSPRMFSLAGSRLVLVTDGHEQLGVQIIDVDKRQPIASLAIPTRKSAAELKRIDRLISVDREASRMLVVEDASVGVIALDRANPDVIARWAVGHPISHVAFLGDGHHAVTVAGRQLAIWNVDHENAVHVVELADDVTAWAVSRTGAVAIADATGTLTLGQLDGYTAVDPTPTWEPPSDAA